MTFFFPATLLISKGAVSEVKWYRIVHFEEIEMSCVACGQPMGFATTGNHLINRVPWLERVLVNAITITDGTNPIFLRLLGELGRQK